MNKRDRWLTFLRILMWVFLAIAAIFALVALCAGVNTAIFLGRAVTTTGVVTGMDQHQDDDGMVTYSPVFIFTARDGSERVGHSNVSSNPSGCEIGDTVPVRYELKNPSVARIATFWQTWGLEAGFGIAAAVMGLVGLFFRWRVIKRKTRPPRFVRIQSLDQI